ncbi:hypothetical protein H0H92_013236 [Tricholoma furcatifolium]|nr:hypothetical protein H0H92_013236 [Tricholoma furcatifolium]
MGQFHFCGYRQFEISGALIDSETHEAFNAWNGVSTGPFNAVNSSGKRPLRPQDKVAPLLERWNQKYFQPRTTLVLLVHEYIDLFPNSPIYAIYLVDMTVGDDQSISLKERLKPLPVGCNRIDIFERPDRSHGTTRRVLGRTTMAPTPKVNSTLEIVDDHQSSTTSNIDELVSRNSDQDPRSHHDKPLQFEFPQNPSSQHVSRTFFHRNLAERQHVSPSISTPSIISASSSRAAHVDPASTTARPAQSHDRPPSRNSLHNRASALSRTQTTTPLPTKAGSREMKIYRGLDAEPPATVKQNPSGGLSEPLNSHAAAPDDFHALSSERPTSRMSNSNQSRVRRVRFNDTLGVIPESSASYPHNPTRVRGRLEQTSPSSDTFSNIMESSTNSQLGESESASSTYFNLYDHSQNHDDSESSCDSSSTFSFTLVLPSPEALIDDIGPEPDPPASPLPVSSSPLGATDHPQNSLGLLNFNDPYN